jgi:hypothetical protein
MPTTAIARMAEPSTRMQTFAIILVIFVAIQGILSTTWTQLSQWNRDRHIAIN